MSVAMIQVFFPAGEGTNFSLQPHPPGRLQEATSGCFFDCGHHFHEDVGNGQMVMMMGIFSYENACSIKKNTHKYSAPPLICALPKLSLLNIKPQHLELLVVLATEDPLPRLSPEPGQQLIKLQRLLLQ